MPCPLSVGCISLLENSGQDSYPRWLADEDASMTLPLHLRRVYPFLGSVLLGTIAFALGFSITRSLGESKSLAGFMGFTTAAIALLARNGHVIHSSHSSSTHSPFPSLARTQVAVFWDHENVRLPAGDGQIAQVITSYVESYGIPRVKRIYANWNGASRLTSKTLTRLGFDQLNVSSGKQNSVDIKLAVDCLTTAYQHPEIRGFVLITGDKDYIPLVTALKTLGREVTLIGASKSLSKDLEQSVDRFIPLQDLIGLPDPQEERLPVRIEFPHQTIAYDDAVVCLKEAIALAKEMQYPPTFELINGLMLRHPQFSYRGPSSIRKADGTFFPRKFSKFVEAAVADGYVHLNEQSHPQELILVDSPPIPSAQFREACAALLQHKTLSYSDAIQCLREAIALANQRQMRPSLGCVNKLMMLHPHYSYTSVRDVEPRDRQRFTQFKQFILAAAQEGYIQIISHNNEIVVDVVGPPPLVPSDFAQKLQELSSMAAE